MADLAEQSFAEHAHADARTKHRIAAFLRGASFETTRLTTADRAAAKGLNAGTRIYVSAVPGRAPEQQIALAAQLQARGAEPIPHIAVREFSSGDAVEQHIGRLTAQAGVRRLLIISGDREEPAGPFHAAIELIESGVLQACGIEEVGIAGYPEGHPRLSSDELDRALAVKLEAAGETGLSVHIVTQFVFAAAPILSWLEHVRALGIDHSVRIGIAGPATLSSLMRFAQICGVKTSAQMFAQAGLVKTMFGLTAPDRVIRPLAEACVDGRFGEVTPHFYSFGGLAGAVRWVMAGATGRIDFEHAGGFTVVAP